MTVQNYIKIKCNFNEWYNLDTTVLYNASIYEYYIAIVLL